MPVPCPSAWAWVPALFPIQRLLMPPWQAQMVAQAFGSLPPMWEAYWISWLLAST